VLPRSISTKMTSSAPFISQPGVGFNPAWAIGAIKSDVQRGTIGALAWFLRCPSLLVVPRAITFAHPASIYDLID
jgi:hypothetical protein